MEPLPEHNVTGLLLKWKAGDKQALESLAPLVENELRRQARAYMRNERPDHALQPTALVNEAWLRLTQQDQPVFEGRSHFFAIAARYMRQILVEYARKRQTQKRGSGEAVLSLDGVVVAAPERLIGLILLNDGLTELERLNVRQARVVDLHFFAGLTFEEISAHLEIGRSTVVRDLRMAQSWLKQYVEQ